MAYPRKLRASLFAISADLFLVGLKGILATATGSLALAADALHSLADLLVSVAVLLSLVVRQRFEKRVSKAPVTHADRVIPGEAEDRSPARTGAWVESLVAAMVAIAILAVPFQILGDLSSADGEPIRNLWLGIVGVTATIAIAHYLSRFKLFVGQQTDSPALEADGQHSAIDALSSMAVLAALFGQMIGLQLDPLVAVIIAVLIGVTGIELLISAIVSLYRGSHLQQISAWQALEAGASRHGAWLKRLFTSRIPKYPLLFAALLAYALSGLTRVDHGDIAARYHLGRLAPTPLQPGLHLLLPWPFERVAVLDSQALRRIEIGFRSPAEAGAGASFVWDGRDDAAADADHESLVVTGDQNLVEMGVVISYRPGDRALGRLHVEDPEMLLSSLGESAVREVTANLASDRLLTTDKAELRRQLEQRLDALLQDGEYGFELVDVRLREVRPPRPIVRAYRDVFAAREDYTKLVSGAQTYRFAALSNARVEGESEDLSAEAEHLERKLRAEGDGRHFTQLADEYGRARDVTAFRMFIESAEKTLTGVPKVVARADVNTGEYRYWLFDPESFIQTRSRDR